MFIKGGLNQKIDWRRRFYLFIYLFIIFKYLTQFRYDIL